VFSLRSAFGWSLKLFQCTRVEAVESAGPSDLASPEVPLWVSEVVVLGGALTLPGIRDAAVAAAATLLMNISSA
jgi:hypothetical protein